MEEQQQQRSVGHATARSKCSISYAAYPFCDEHGDVFTANIDSFVEDTLAGFNEFRDALREDIDCMKKIGDPWEDAETRVYHNPLSYVSLLHEVCKKDQLAEKYAGIFEDGMYDTDGVDDGDGVRIVSVMEGKDPDTKVELCMCVEKSFAYYPSNKHVRKWVREKFGTDEFEIICCNFTVKYFV